MLKSGQSLLTEKGRRVEIQGFLASGNQGKVFRARGAEGQALVLKVFLDPGEDLERRTAFLVRNMTGMGPTVLAPTDRVVSPGLLATLAPFVPGPTLETWLQASPRAGDLKTRLIMALGLAASVENYHARGWTPGDLGADQFIVQETPILSTVRLVDVDSLVAPGLPAPRTLGKLPYFSPELRQAFLTGRKHPITPQSDLFSLGVLLHELLLLRHPAEGHAAASDPEAYHRVLMEGWPDDPLARRKGLPQERTGFPVALLDPNTQRILRLALSPDPSARPSAASIKLDLATALSRMCSCPCCSWGILPFEGQACCPHPECSAIYGVPRFHGAGLTLALDRPRMMLGRAELPSPQISRQHLEVRRMGPCLEVVSLGANGTFLWRESSWTRLLDGKPTLLVRGDVIRLGGFQLRLAA
jgi:serine/threonine protein kinase